MLSKEQLNEIQKLEKDISDLTSLAADGLIADTMLISAKTQVMAKINKLKKEYIDRVHAWNERDKEPRTKSRRGEKITYYMTHIKIGREIRQISASTLDGLYEKLYDHYADDQNPLLDKNITLRDLFYVFITERKRDAYEYHTISTQTAHYDETTWQRFFSELPIADTKVSAITQRMIFNVYKMITGDGKLTLKAFNKAKTLLDAMFNLAMESGIIENNPSRYISKQSLKFKQADNRSEVYTPEERNILLKYLETQRESVYTLAIRLAFCFCIRIGELTALTWDDYDEDSKSIHIWHQIIYAASDGKMRVQKDVPHTKTSTAEGNRYLYVSNMACDTLEKLRKINGDKHYILNARRSEMPITENKFNEHLKKYCREAGIRYFSSHKIRFYGATELFNAGVDPEQIRRTMGHTTLAMTEHYNRTNGQINVDTDTWNRIFGDPDKKPGES